MLQTPGFVFGPSLTGSCDDAKVGGGVVARDPIDDSWIMWCYCRDSAFDAAAPPTLGTGRIRLARSTDGVHWRRVEGSEAKGSVLAPSAQAQDFDSLHIGLGDVRRVGDQWFMWYFGGDRARRSSLSEALRDVVGLGLRPGLAVSDDGLHWRRLRGATESGALLDYTPDQLYAGWPNVFHDGRRFVMQYTSPSLAFDHFHTNVVTSEDGLLWSDPTPLQWRGSGVAYDSGGMVTRQVIANPNRAGCWLMIYTAADAGDGFRRSIAAAASEDGQVWTRLYDRPIFKPSEAGGWDDGGVAVTSVLASGAELRLYYYGFGRLGVTDTTRGIGLAVSQDGDLQGLSRA